jgi:hypothetical protein
MRSLIFASILLSLAVTAFADILVLNDIKAQNGVQLSATELNDLMPKANVVSHTQAGSTRRWTNESDGTFVASGDNRGRSGGAGRPAQGRGTWHVGPNGTYCVTIEWPASSENWCRYLFKVGAEYYGVKSPSGGTGTAYRLEISK